MNNPLNRVNRLACANVATATVLEVEHFDGLMATLQKRGAEICRVDLVGITDETELFMAIVAALPIPNYASGHSGINFVALLDLMRDGLWEANETALVVMHADCLLSKHLNLVFDLFSTFLLSDYKKRLSGISGNLHVFFVTDDQGSPE